MLLAEPHLRSFSFFLLSVYLRLLPARLLVAISISTLDTTLYALNSFVVFLARSLLLPILSRVTQVIGARMQSREKASAFLPRCKS